MRGKKGVSPLIATVLLIAFAVSLGAVLINLGVNLFGDPCANRSAEVLIVEGIPRVCHSVLAKTMSLTVVNQGKKGVDGFKLSIIGNVAYNEDIPESLGPLEKKVISYPVPDLTQVDVVSIVPFYISSGQTHYCSAKQKDYTPIADC